VTHAIPPSITPPRWWAWLLVSVAVIVLDQLTKALVVANIHPGEIRSVTSFFGIVLAFNAGAAFSFLSDAAGWQRYVLGGIAVAAAALLIAMLRRGGSRVYCAGLSLILGGAIGNLWDRATQGKVVDFLFFHDYLPFRNGATAWMDPFPAFNVADSAITIGACLLIIDSFMQQRVARRGTIHST
jgi:signal peptidase II